MLTNEGKKLGKRINDSLKKNEHNIMGAFFGMGMVLSLMLIIMTVHLYDTGFHNSDAGHNLKYLNSEYNMSFVECHDAPCNDAYTASKAYDLGRNQEDIGFFAFGYGMFSFVFCLFLFSECLEKEAVRKYKEEQEKKQ